MASKTETPRAVWCCSMCGAVYHKDFPRCPTDGGEVLMVDRDPMIGSSVGHYEIEHLIGEGGMGRVYLAHHATLPNKQYAFKVLLGDHSASAAMRTRFTREAERASQLAHPNIAQVVDFGQTERGLLYIVMEYVDGPSLVSLIGDAPMAPARVAGLAREICKALQYAHDAGIVHRDLKPENILVSRGPAGEEVPRLVDFGLAMSVDQSDARLTESGMTMGTPAFAAPEQLSGKPIDHRADLYALGMTMFEMLTGGLPPVEGSMMEVVAARTARDAPRVSERMPGLVVPPVLDDIVAKLTRRRPADRYLTASEVIDALDAFEAGEPVAVAPPAVAAAAPVVVEPPPVVDDEPPITKSSSSRLRTEPMQAAPRRGVIAGVLGVAALAVIAVFTLRGAPAAPAQVAAPASEATAAQGKLESAIPEPPVEVAATAVAVAAPPPARTAMPPVRRASVAAAPAAAPEPAVRAEHIGAAVEARSQPAPEPRAPTEPRPRALYSQLQPVEVSGSLPPNEVQRAVDRQRAAIARCAATTTAPATVTAKFSIGEQRRARAIRTTGPVDALNTCVGAALTDVRTESAPDVGDVDVTVRIAFAVKQ